MKKYKFKVSVIMSIYNVGEFINEAIDSIINQTLNFKENVELILVNDGSTDNSEEICVAYKNMYPDNIKYIYKTNGGLSSARNEGLKHVEGEYVTFTDPDDYLSLNCFEEVCNFFDKNNLYLDMVTIPLYLFEAETGLHGKYAYMGNKNKIINLISEPYNFVLSSAASFYKSKTIRRMKFDEAMLGAEDIKFNLILYRKNPLIGYVCEHNVKYFYRKRFNGTSIVDDLKTNPKGFYSVLKMLNLINNDNILPYEKEIIIYELRSRLKNIDVAFFETEKEYNRVINKYKKYLNSLEDSFILKQSKWVTSMAFKLLLMKFRNLSYTDLAGNNRIPILQNLNLKNYYFEDKQFVVELVFNNYGYSELELVAYDGNNNVIRPIEAEDIDGPFDTKYGNFVIDITHYRKFKFDLKNQVIRFALFNRKTNNYYPINKLSVDKFTRLVLKHGSIGLRKKGYLVCVFAQKIKIRRYTKSTFYYNCVSMLKIIKRFKYFAFLRLFNKRNKKYILINDRPEKAGDNGEALFKYINLNRKDLKKVTYFVIDKKSDDYKRLKKIGNVVNIRSLKHKYMFINCKMLYSSHNHKLFYNAFDLEHLKYYSDLFDYKFVWLQHGIIKDDLSNESNGLNTKDDYMVVSTKGEYDEIDQTKYFLGDKKLILTGLARYDYLDNEPKNIVTICPTWRKELTGKILEDGTHEALPNFEKSDYYSNYKELLESDELNALLSKYNYRMNFVLHPGMVNYIEYFKKFENDHIKILNQNDVVYSDIFKESKLLITDYSSVFFDFAYLKKPEIFFQFDSDTFFTKHYKIGYFDYKKDAFGDILMSPSEVVDKIKFYFKNDFKMENKYIERVNNTFAYNDKNNCKRILNATLDKNKEL